MDQIGTSSPFTCPECHGVLWFITDGRVLRFRCRTGHAYAPESFLADLSENIEAMLWNTVRAMEEYGSFLGFLVQHLEAQKAGARAQELSALAQQMGRQLTLIRQAVELGVKH